MKLSYKDLESTLPCSNCECEIPTRTYKLRSDFKVPRPKKEFFAFCNHCDCESIYDYPPPREYFVKR